MLRNIGRVIKVMAVLILVAMVGALATLYLLDDYDAYIVKSDSMQPTIKCGDMVIIGSPGSPFTGEIAPGEIITFERDENLITHRIVSVDGDTIRTKGDGQEETDPWTVSRFYDVKGSYICHIPYIGMVSNFIKTKTGWFLCVILPAACLLGFIIKDIVKEVRQRLIYS
jgi:signal peptidase